MGVFEAMVHRILLTLLLLALTVVVVLGVVPVLAASAPEAEEPLVVGALLVVGLQMFHGRARWLVDWLLRGERGDPAAAAYRVASTLGNGGGDVEAVLRAMAVPLRLGYAEVGDASGVVVASFGGRVRDAATFPIHYGTRDLGTLRAAGRWGAPLTRADERLLGSLAVQLGVVLHALSLAAELRVARSGLVRAREDERARLSRDLHDGLGPALAGIALGVDAVRAAQARNTARVPALLADVRADVTGCVEEVRRIVADLRPLRLDQVGLAASLRQATGALARGERPTVHVEADGLPELPAAVEVAAYRIATEAVTNVVRHAEAERVEVMLQAAGAVLVVEVRDDGRGGAAERSGGNGLRTMRERAEEIGGSLTVSAGDDGRGTRIIASLPWRPA
ncbi:MAG: sensor histidine kinase [Frankia sp.]|nr:sensor histidine kinase [Frankia sp.]